MNYIQFKIIIILLQNNEYFNAILYVQYCMHASITTDINLAGDCFHNHDYDFQSNSSNGIVEVCLDGNWGPICGDDWSYNDASVACKQLGYSPYG